MQAAPSIWLIIGDKGGDNAQVFALEQALDWPCERKRIEVLEAYRFAKPKVKASLYHIDLERSDPLEPPWPDLIITVGRRPSMVALWVREQSGGRSRIVLVGKPSESRVEEFDLVIASAEYRLPPLPNVLPVLLPLMQVNKAAVAAAAETWRARLEPLPKPLIVFLVGGPTGPFVYEHGVVERLLAMAAEIAGKGGTPYFTTSRRTPPAVIERLQAGLADHGHLFRWTPDAADNPYLGLLGLADGFIVTGDSISMMVEVIRLGKPLAIFPLPSGPLGRADQIRRALTRRLFQAAAEQGSLSGRLARGLYRLGLIGQTRDFNAFYRLLIERGLAVWAGEAFQAPRGPVPDDAVRGAAAIKALVSAG